MTPKEQNALALKLWEQSKAWNGWHPDLILIYKAAALDAIQAMLNKQPLLQVGD